MVKVVFVCLGNICRSPTAEGVFRKFVENAGLQDKIYIESAGTSAYHEGELPDPRSRQVAQQRGYQLDSLSQPFLSDFFEKFDMIITMDRSNYNNVVGQARSPEEAKKVTPFHHFCESHDITHVPDPYNEGPEGFDLVLDIVEDGSRGLLSRIKESL